MPNCFSLTRKGESKPCELQQVDEQIREHFKAPPDPVNWFRNWYNTLGMDFAFGKSPESIQKEVLDGKPLYDK